MHCIRSTTLFKHKKQQTLKESMKKNVCFFFAKTRSSREALKQKVKQYDLCTDQSARQRNLCSTQTLNYAAQKSPTEHLTQPQLTRILVSWLFVD